LYRNKTNWANKRGPL